MRKLYVFIMIPLFMMSCDPKSFQQAMDILNTPLTNQEVARGLKAALDLGVGESVDFLSAKDGYYQSAYKILLPEEVAKVTSKLSFVPGFEDVQEVLIQKINRAAEDAAGKAGPIFLSAIKGISFGDAMNILMGNKNAATQYLHTGTYDQLYTEFDPVIGDSMSKFNVEGYWANAVNAYNKIPLVDKVNPDLSDHITNSALSGLFSLVEKKELGIRSDINQRSTALLQKVFAKQDGQ